MKTKSPWHSFISYFLSVQILFPIQKKTVSGKVPEQSSTSTAVVERDPELERLEQMCYADLLDCCKTLAHEAGVTYTSIMNLQVLFGQFSIVS